MNQQQRAVVQQALEALEKARSRITVAGGSGWKLEAQRCINAITALRQLLEQPEPVQEPVAWVKQILDAFPLFDDDGLDEEEHHCEWALQQDRKRLHAMLTTPPAQPAVPTQCWKCGDMDAMGHAKCDVPACGMREKKTALDKMAGNARELGLNYDNKAVRDA
jgi:hypothetical protein